MKAILVALSAALTLFFISPALAMTPDELAAELQVSYDKTHDLTADFTQISEVTAMHMIRESTGKLTIKKPGLLRYTYLKPEKNELLIKGEELTMYMPGAKQMVRRKLSRAMLDKTPATFLAGMGRITDSFHVRFPEAGPRDSRGNHLLMLVPRGDRMGVKSIMLTLKPDTYGIIGFAFTDESGNTNTTRLSNIKINKGVKDSVFELDIPKGTKLIAE